MLIFWAGDISQHAIAPSISSKDDMLFPSADSRESFGSEGLIGARFWSPFDDSHVSDF